MELVSAADVFDYQELPQDVTVFDDDLLKLSVDLVNTLRANRGIVLSAPQVGINKNILVLNTEPALVCINPKIVYSSPKQILFEDTCLTFPGLFVKVNYPEEVRVRFKDPHGDVVARSFFGLTAKAFCNGVNVLNRIKFYENASAYHKELGFNKRRKLFKRIRKN
jgi:peptide deformylase